MGPMQTMENDSDIMDHVESIALANEAMASNVLLRVRAQRMRERLRLRDLIFRHAVMADGSMAIMLSLFLSELDGLPLTNRTLALVATLEDRDAEPLLQNLANAGLIVMTGENPARRTVGLSPIGSAQMRRFLSDFPEY